MGEVRQLEREGQNICARATSSNIIRRLTNPTLALHDIKMDRKIKNESQE